MLALPNYHFHEKLFEGSKTVVYRGIRETDKLPVIAKQLKKLHPSESELNWLEYEYRIVKQLNLPCVSDMYSIENTGRSKVILMEDFGAISLDKYLRSGIPDIETFLQLAISITRAIADIHHHNIIHKDLKPANILVNHQTHKLKITGFGISAQISRENQQAVDQDILEGTLAYISPEQTGRMNRSIDYRSDFYSLGATFYEILTGRPPFTSRDSSEVIHAQIALQPDSPKKRRPEIPRVLSQIIMKLLDKAPEKRYQSSRGLLADLIRCRNTLASDKDLKMFEIGQDDLPEKFHPPEKLYGREKEIEILNTTFSDVGKGDTKMLLIEGPPGIGKTFLIQEIHKPLVAQKGFFISGKFDQYKGNTPYAPIVQAFQEMIKHLLTLSQEELEKWKEQLLNALSPNSKVIVDIIPELEAIIGPPPPVPSLGPTEALNRLNLTFQKFIRAFASSDHPLVMFIDDWQWADSATLGLLYSLMTDKDISHLLFIGAYRDTEVSSGHPFMIKLDEIRQSQLTSISTLCLLPLHLDNIIEFVGDALHCSPERAAPLATLIHQKTQGNPFFIKQFTQILYDEDFLWFDREKGKWFWDISKASTMEAAENVVDLMVNQFNNLPEKSRHELQLASCIGNQFDLATLATISESSPSESFAKLRDVVAKGYLLPLDNNYKLFWLGNNSGKPIHASFRFAHDKIQQAAYDLAAEDDRQPTHLTIGRMLLKKVGETNLDGQVFDVVDQFNQAIQLIVATDEKEMLVRLNLKAALKAKSSAAFGSASEYLQKGCTLLSDDAWQKHYLITRDLYRERAEVEYLVGNFEKSEKLIHYLLDSVQTDMEKAEIYNLFIVQKTMSANFADAITAGREALKLLDITLQEENLDEVFEEELQATYRNLGDKNVTDIINEPDMNDERRRLQILLLTNICSAAYRSDQALFRILVLKAVNISLTHGLVVESCYTFSAYGLLLGSILGDFETGYQFGLLALKISEKYNNPTQDCRTNFVISTTLVHWVRHAREADAVSDRCYNVGLDTGEFQFAGYILTYKLTNLIFQGKNLLLLMDTTNNYLQFVTKTKNRWATDMISGTQMVLSNLLGFTGDSKRFSHRGINEEEFFASCKEINNYSALCRYHIFKALALYVIGHYRQAREVSKAAGELITFLFGTIYSAEHFFVESLVLTRLLDSCEPDEQKRYLGTIRENQAKLEKLADNCEENFRHRHLLIEAELERFAGNDLEAMELYDRAISLAGESDYVQNEAIANERAGEFWLKRKNTDIATLYLKKGYRCYQQWGASVKLEQMSETYPDFLNDDVFQGELLAQDVTIDQETVSLDHMNVDTLVKALQAISGEIILESLLEKLMLFVVMDAGADRGALLLSKKGNFFLEAEISGGEKATNILRSIPLEESRTPQSLIRYVARTKETVVVDNAPDEPLLDQDDYVEKYNPKSILCMPIIRQRQLSAVLYMENKSVARVFTPKRQKILSLLGAQVAISLENAMLFEEINHEIIDRRRAEKALRRSEERFRELADLLPQIIFEADTEGRLTFINHHGFSSLGYTREMFEEGITARDLVVPEEHAKLRSNLKDILDGMPPRGNSYYLKRRDGSQFPVIAYSNRVLHDGKVRGFRGIIVDVTELRKAETELKNTRNYLNNLFNTLPSILVSVDEQGRIQKWNDGAEVFTGHKAETVVGKSLWEHMPLLEPFKESLFKVFSSGDSIHLYKQKVSRDTKKYFDIFFYPLSYEGELGAVIRIDDVTELVTKDQQLHHAQKMETIGSLAGGLAHDFNNLLSGITGTLSLVNVQLAMGTTIPHEKLRSYVTIMETASNRAASLVTQLQTLSRRQPLSLSIFGLSSSVENVVKICRNTMDKSIDIEIFNDEGDALVEADQGQIEQVLLNICINASHAMTLMRGAKEKQGGILTLSIENFDTGVSGSSPLLSGLHGAYLLLRVRDTGVGMDSETSARIFDPFFTSKETGVGTGLGLAMAYNIVKQHKGIIDVNSELGRGTVFNIFLPKTEERRTVPQPLKSELELGRGAGLILIIDDEEIVRETAGGMLKALGYEVLLADGADEGIPLYREHREKIHAILLDMAMPKKSGMEVFVELKKINKNVKVVLSSGFRHDRRVEETMKLGVREFIQKPYSLDQLIKTMDKVIGD